MKIFLAVLKVSSIFESTNKKTTMKNTQTIHDAKIQICEKFIKDMSKMMRLENHDTEQQSKTINMIYEVEQMLHRLYQENHMYQQGA